MAFLTWTDNLSVEIPKIDEQHKKLVELVNTLHDAMRAGHGKDILGKVLAELIDYTGYHFKTEEEAFARFGYPQADEHKKQHDALVKTALDLKGKMDSGEMMVTVETLNYLSGWVTNHIMKEDKLYTPFLKGKPV
jgi:hemerythrin-like metal-binding protein